MKIFISAVSAEFKACRDALASSVHAAGAREVKVQEDFSQGPGTLLEKLEAYIAESERVIVLVGDVFGAEPYGDEAPEGSARRSYTQWEYYFAIGERLTGERVKPKDVFVYFASPEFPRDTQARQTADVSALQQEFIRTILRSGKDRSSFASRHELCHLVLRDGFRLPQSSFKENLPYKSLGKLFKGRDGFLSNLHDRVLSRMDPNSRAKPVAITQNPSHVICGLGGIGKTRFAVEYALRFADDYSALLFVVADTPEHLRQGVADLALVLDIKEVASTEDIEERFKAALGWLMEHPGWCLILDNVDNEAAAMACEDFVSKLYGGHVIITSRLRRWSVSGIEALDLDVLDALSAKAMLLERTPHRAKRDDDERSAQELATLLDGLALGLEQAGAFIETEQCSFAEYLKWWKDGDDEVTGWYDERVMKYPRSVAVTWRATIKTIGTAGEAILRLLCSFAPAPIPARIVVGPPCAAALSGFLKKINGGSTKPSPRSLITRLASFSMLNRTTQGQEQFLALHRVVRDITWRRVPEEERVVYLETATRLFDIVTPHDADRFENWAAWRLMLPHAECLWQALESSPKDHWSFRLLHGLALYYLGQNRKGEGAVLQQHALDLMTQLYGEGHPDTLQAKNDLALLVEDRQEALRLLREAFEGLKHAHEADRAPATEIKMLECAHNLALMNDDPAEEESLLLLCSQGFTESIEAGPRHWRTLLTNKALAYHLWRCGRKAEARELAGNTLELYQRNPELGLHHKDTLDSFEQVAAFLDADGKSEDAERLLRSELAGRETTPGLGPQHPDTLDALMRLLNSLWRGSRLSEAEKVCRGKLQEWRESIGAQHASAVTCAQFFIQILARNNKLDEARQVEVELRLAVARKAYYELQAKSAEESRELLLCMNAVADGQKDCGQIAEAESTYLRCIDGMKNVMGEFCEDLAVALNNYSLLLRDVGRLDDSLRCYEDALRIDEKLHLSENLRHPKVPHRLNNVAMVFMMLGRYDEATAHLARAWSLKGDAHDVTSARILWVRLAIAMLRREPVGELLGKIKSLFAMPEARLAREVDDFWNVASVLKHLAGRLDASDIRLLSAVVDEINAGAHFHLPAGNQQADDVTQAVRPLYALRVWQEQAPIALDTANDASGSM